MPPKYHDKFYEGCFYHIYNRSINKEIAFKSERNYLFFLGRWHKYLAELLEVYAYCLLPTHYHFFTRVKDRNSFTKPQRFGSAAHFIEFHSENLKYEKIDKFLFT